MLTVGPKKSGDTYKIGIQKPFDDSGSPIASVDITDASLVSSGVYERYFEKDGKRYHHILNPKPGILMRMAYLVLPLLRIRLLMPMHSVPPVLHSA